MSKVQFFNNYREKYFSPFLIIIEKFFSRKCGYMSDNEYIDRLENRNKDLEISLDEQRKTSERRLNIIIVLCVVIFISLTFTHNKNIEQKEEYEESYNNYLIQKEQLRDSIVFNDYYKSFYDIEDDLKIMSDYVYGGQRHTQKVIENSYSNIYNAIFEYYMLLEDSEEFLLEDY